MPTKAAKKKPAATGRDAVLIPPDAEGILDKWALIKLLHVSERKFKQMLSTGEYPRPDFCLGKLARWTATTHSEWAHRKRMEGPNGGGCQQAK